MTNYRVGWINEETEMINTQSLLQKFGDIEKSTTKQGVLKIERDDRQLIKLIPEGEESTTYSMKHDNRLKDRRLFIDMMTKASKQLMESNIGPQEEFKIS